MQSLAPLRLWACVRDSLAEELVAAAQQAEAARAAEAAAARTREQLSQARPPPCSRDHTVKFESSQLEAPRAILRSKGQRCLERTRL